MENKLITQIAKMMNLSEAEVRAAVDKINNIPQPCYHHGPIQGVCKSAKCSECDVIIRKGDEE